MINNIAYKAFSKNIIPSLILLFQLTICFILMILVFFIEYNHLTLTINNIELQIINRKLISDVDVSNMNVENIIAVFPIVNNNFYKIIVDTNEIVGIEIGNKYYSESSLNKYNEMLGENDVLVSSALYELIGNNNMIKLKFFQKEYALHVVDSFLSQERVIVLNDNQYDEIFNTNIDSEYQIIVDNYKSINNTIEILKKKGINVYKSNTIQEYEIKNLYSLSHVYSVFKIVFLIILYLCSVFLIKHYLSTNYETIRILKYIGYKDCIIALTIFKYIIKQYILSLAFSLFIVILLNFNIFAIISNKIYYYILFFIMITVVTLYVEIKYIILKMKRG